jgi:hypothetical protein
MGKIDLKDAYHSIIMNQDSRPLLAFQWKNKIFQWSRLPFGLSTAPYIFSRMLKLALSPLRAKGVVFVQYLDDILILGETKEAVQINFNLIMEQLVKLGFQINVEKSVLLPCQKIQFLGFMLDSLQDKIYAPKEKLRKLAREAIKLYRSAVISAKKLASWIGLANNLAIAIQPALLNLRWCQRALTTGLKSTRSWSKLFSIDNNARGELK